MLGHIKPTLCRLPQDINKHYWKYYCSVCSTLRSENNVAYGALLNNEITAILIAFAPYIKNAKEGQTNCPAQFYLKKKNVLRDPVVELAGDLSIMLGWIKALDWQVDDPKIGKKLIVNLLEKKVNKFEYKISDELKNILKQYAELTVKNEVDFEIVKEQSGKLAYAIAKEIGKATSATNSFIEYQAETFRCIGELINIADHLIDFNKDLNENNYNPIIYLTEKKDTSFYYEYKQLFADFIGLKKTIATRLDTETDDAFATVLNNSLIALNKKIKNATPDFVKEGNEEVKEQYQLEYAECCDVCECCSCCEADCNGCDCGNCDTCLDCGCCACDSASSIAECCSSNKNSDDDEEEEES